MADSNWSVRIGTRVTDDIQKQLDTMPKKTVTVKAVLDNTGLKTIGATELTKYEDALGNVVVANKKFDASGKELNNTIKSVKSTVDTTSQTLQTASKHTKTLGQDFIDTAGKVAKFGAITAIFGLVTTAIGNAVKSVKELDSAMVEFKKVSSLSGSGLDNYTKKLGELGLEVARTKEEMVEASTEFVKAGYTEEESAKLAKTASLFQNIADTELSASEASTVLISNMKAFGMTSADSERVVDVINEVSNVFAVSSSDISAGLSKTASAMSTLGNTYEQSIALMVGAGEQMPNQSGKIARGLRSIGLEIVKTAKQTKELETGYGDVTLSLYDQNGALKSTFDIMSELYPTWQKMTNEQKTNLGISLAGKQQYEVFSATMEGFDQVLKANEVGLNAMGSAMKENEAYMGGIEAKTKLLKAQFDLLVNGDGGLNSFIKGVLDAGTAILKFANSDVGGLIIKTTLLTTVLILLNSGLKGLSSALITAGTKAYYSAMGISAQAVATALANGATIGFTASLKALGIAFLSSPFGKIAFIVAGISALVKVVNHFNETLEESRAKLEETKTEFLDASEAVETTTSKLKDVEEKIREINKLGGASVTKDGELERLKQQETALKNMLALEINRKNLANEDLETQARETIGKEVSSRFIMEPGVVDRDGTTINSYIPERVTRTDEIIAGSDALKEYQANVVEIEESFASGKISQDEYSESIGYAKDEVKRTNAYLQEMSDSLSEDVNGLDETSESYKIATQATSYYADALVDCGIVTEEQLGLAEEVNDEYSDAEQTLTDYEKALKDLDSTLSILSGTTMSGLADAFSLLKDAQEEINDTGSLSIDTYESLMNLGAKYQSLLFDENGQLRLNEESITAVYNAKIDEMAITSARNMVELAGQLNTENKSFADLANSTNRASVAGWEQVAVMMAELELSERDSKALQVRIDGIKQWAKEAKKSVGTYSKTTKAISTQTDAIKKQKEALEDNINKYKSAFKYVEKLLDKDIDKVNELKDAEMARIDASIKALEEQRTNEEKYWDDKISALEAQNDAIEDQIELEQLQANLALARSKRVMVMGTNGKFGYGQDESAIADAEQALSDYTRQQQMETELAILNNLKDQSLANIDSQIGAWETYKESQEANFDSQIATLEAYKQNFEDMTNSYEDEQSRLNALQLFGSDFEKQTWDTRLVNLANFVNEYNKLQASLSGLAETPTEPSTTSPTPITPSATGGGVSAIIAGGNAGTSTIGGARVGASVGVGGKRVKAYASGVASVPNDGMAITGDNPNNRELVIGSKLNGTATMLSQGSGVVNAQSTKSLAGILNTLGSSMGLNGQTIGATTTNQSNATSQSIQIANITLPSVTNGQGLLDELRGFASGMLQTAYSNG